MQVVSLEDNKPININAKTTVLKKENNKDIQLSQAAPLRKQSDQLAVPIAKNSLMLPP